MTSPVDAFSLDPGLQAGRIAPAHVVPLDGLFVFCLGNDDPGVRAFLRPGDFAQVSQAGTLPAGNVYTFQARTRPPSSAPPLGYAWVASALLDGVTVGSRTLLGTPGPTDWEWDVDVAGLVGSHTVAFRLTLTGPALPGPPPATNVPFFEVEIPAFYVDDLAFSTPATQPFLTNEDPTDGQGLTTGAAPPDSTPIDFQAFGLGLNVDPTSIQVTVNGAPAIVNGAFQTGFSGTIGAAAEVVAVHLVPAGPFASASTVTVAATAKTVGGAHTHTRTWSFAVQDTTPPTMAIVQAIAPRQIRVTWSKGVVAANPAAPEDALNPSLYRIDGTAPDANTPFVASPYLTVVRAAIVFAGPPDVIDLFTDDDLTPGIAYVLTEFGVADPLGNAATSAAGFTGFVPPAVPGRVFDLYRILPLINRAEDVTLDLLKFIRCLQEPANLLLYGVDVWTDLFDVDVADEPYLDAMLADLGNPFPFVLDTAGKRRLLRLLVALYGQKGTGIGIINAVRFFLGITVTISSYVDDTMQLGISELGVDWILGPGSSFALYAFNVVSAVALTDEQIAQITFLANYLKPAHTHLIAVLVPSTPPVYDPVELGVSELGVDWLLHE